MGCVGEMSESNNLTNTEQQSSDPTLSRKDFIRKAAKGATLVAGAAMAPQILDKFLVPKAYAALSVTAGSCSVDGANTHSAGSKDHVNVTKSGTDSVITCNGADTNQTTCTGAGNDAGLTC